MKMWDGRFEKASDSLMEAFNNSLPFDKNLIEEDIEGSIAWTKALVGVSIFSSEEANIVIAALKTILVEYKQGKIEFLPSDEDIHMAVERLLTERVGELGARLHTGRSRNDQVATDTRLWTKKAIVRIRKNIIELQKSILFRAESDRTIIVPGFTHLQQAQPILLAHYWMSLFFLLEREKSRLDNALKTTDIMPLGAGAMAGSGFDIDRGLLAQDLCFNSASKNSIDAVASRDFILETLSSIASLGIHLSRYAEDLIIWSSREFSFVELDDAWSTGSSMMPQKKNPDSLELIRGKSGRFTGNYIRFATVLKGIGLTYFKDLQEDKEPIFDSIHHMEMVLTVFTNVLFTLKVNEPRIREDLDPFLLATDLADYLARKGIPFRSAHKVVGKIVAYCIESGTALTALPLEKLQEFSSSYERDVLELFTWEGAVGRRTVNGGTGYQSVDSQIAYGHSILA